MNLLDTLTVPIGSPAILAPSSMEISTGSLDTIWSGTLIKLIIVALIGIVIYQGNKRR